MTTYVHSSSDEGEVTLPKGLTKGCNITTYNIYSGSAMAALVNYVYNRFIIRQDQHILQFNNELKINNSW